jgi:ABC-type sulfate transport system permease subunit
MKLSEILIGLAIYAAICLVWAYTFYQKTGSRFWHYFILTFCVTPIIAKWIYRFIPVTDAAIEKNMMKQGNLKHCPLCSQLIATEAVYCKFCQRTIVK